MICSKADSDEISLVFSSKEMVSSASKLSSYNRESSQNFNQNSSFGLYLKEESKEKRIKKGESAILSTSKTVVTVRTKRTGDLDIPLELKKMNQTTFKFFKF